MSRAQSGTPSDRVKAGIAGTSRGAGGGPTTMDICPSQLYQPNGQTAIQSGSFIGWAQAVAGLKFTPQTGFQGVASFQFQAAVSATEEGLGGQMVTAQIQVQLQQLSCQLTINQGLNLVGLPLQPESEWRLPQLLAALPADFLFYYDGTAFQYYGGGESTVVVEGGVSYVVVRNQADSASVELSGQAWDNVNDGQPGFRLTLQPAINMISVPLQPQSGDSFNLQQLFEQLPIDFMFYYDGSGFQYYNGGAIDQPVTAGRGYVALNNSDQAVEYIYRGSGWQSSLSVAPAIWTSVQPASDQQTGVMAIVGQLDLAPEMEVETDQLQLQLINRRSGQSWWSSVSAQGGFSWALINWQQPDLIRVDDQLAVEIDDGQKGRYQPLEIGKVRRSQIQAHRIELGPVSLEALPQFTTLAQNYPNPFNPETWIPYQLNQASEVSLSVYSSNGTLVRQIDLGHQPAGHYRTRQKAVYWDGRNANGESVSSGVYFYQLTAGDYRQMRKMVILK